AFGVPPERLAVVPHPIASADGAAREIGDPVRFGFVGNIAPAKGVHLLCDAFSRVRGDSVLRLFGGTPDNSYFRRLRPYLNSRVTYEGAFDQSSLSEVYGAIDVVVIPSLVEESFSLVASEAQEHGRPVIAAATGALPEVVDHERNGLLVPPGDVSALAAAIARCQDRTEVERMAAVARSPADASAYAGKIEEIYRLVTARAARATSTP
ncbi:MAG: glycosyltransferase, partial [Actinomycetota bacterium]|nr:glycosyltransferase [Actinomycetota bacterium]